MQVRPDFEPAGGVLAAPRHPVVLGDVPVRLFRHSEQHADDVLRELALIVQSGRPDGLGPDSDGLARDAVRLVEQTALVRAELAIAIATAADRGDESATIRLDLPLAAGALATEWTALLDRLGQLCASGVMLTVPPSPAIVALRQWYAGELAGQLSGQPPRPWRGARA